MAGDFRFGALKSGAFRFALLLALVFACGSVVLLLVVARQIGTYATEATQTVLKYEAAVLTDEYRHLGLPGLTGAMARHGDVGQEAQFQYLLLDAHGKRLYGDLPMDTAQLGWGQFRAKDIDGDLETLTRYGIKLADGSTLVIATDNFDIEEMRQRLIAFTAAGGLAVTLFSLIGGYLVGRVFLRRLDHVNTAVETIIGGNYRERLPNIGIAPEFDGLSRNLNHMLDSNAAALEAVKQVSTAIAHDLRTPLTRLRQSLESARQDEQGDPGPIDDAIDQTDEILATFQALLRIGMLEGGVGRKYFTRVNLSEVLDRVHQAYAPASEDAQHEFVSVHEPEVCVEGDAGLLAQLFSNLVENAILHTPVGTRIVSKLEKDGGAVLASISDNGPGVPASDRDLIFRKFYRGDENRTTQGAGLGLSLVAAIADLHRVTYNLAPGQSGFCIELRFTPWHDATTARA
jgi:signal transduction histidine kinase